MAFGFKTPTSNLTNDFSLLPVPIDIRLINLHIMWAIYLNILCTHSHTHTHTHTHTLIH
jgi:hypothetical protein